MANKKQREFDLSTHQGRLALVIHEHPNNAQLAKDADLQPSYMTRLLNLQETTLDKAARIAKVTGYSMNWISFGIGPRLLDGALSNEMDSDFLKVPSLVADQKLDIDFDPDYLTNILKANPQDCLAWEVTDEAMRGKYEKGQTVLIDKSFLIESGDYVVKINGAFTIRKIIHPLPGICKISSTTMDEVELDISSEPLENKLPIAGRVIWYGGKA